MYTLVKLRLPNDTLYNDLQFILGEQGFLEKLSPKDTAQVAWALARTEIPAQAPIFKKLRDQIIFWLSMLQESDGVLRQTDGEESDDGGVTKEDILNEISI